MFFKKLRFNFSNLNDKMNVTGDFHFQYRVPFFIAQILLRFDALNLLEGTNQKQLSLEYY